MGRGTRSLEGLAVMGIQEFYRQKKVLLTGHTGFKGSWLSLWLQKSGAQLTGVALAPDTDPNLFSLLSLTRDMRSEIADIRELGRLQKIFAESQPEIVIHNAAQPLVLRSYADPVGTFETNVIGTANVLEAARHTASVRAIVVVTTDKCYENREWEYGYRENDRLGGRDPYSSSKAAAEIVTHSYRESFFQRAGIGVATVRAGNVIGGGDWAEDRIVPDIIRGLAKDGKVALRQPHARRPWQHVLEPLRGYLMIGQRLYEDGAAWAEAWNFGPRDESVVNVEELTRMAIERWGSGQIEILGAAGQQHEARTLRLDCSKARERLQWQPLFDLHESIATTVDWYKEVLPSRESARDVTSRQIDSYIARMHKIAP